MTQRWLMSLGLAAAALLTSTATLATPAQPSAADPALEARVMVVAEELRCLVCQNETLASSRAELANDLRVEVRGLVKAGKTDTEIKQYLVARYGDFVLYRPEVKPVTWLLWFGPFVVLLGAFGLTWLYVRERQKQTGHTALSEAQRARADHVLNPTDHP
jgi:cytochrome c-type biogenesis protein CcmH